MIRPTENIKLTQNTTGINNLQIKSISTFVNLFRLYLSAKENEMENETQSLKTKVGAYTQFLNLSRRLIREKKNGGYL